MGGHINLTVYSRDNCVGAAAGQASRAVRSRRSSSSNCNTASSSLPILEAAKTFVALDDFQGGFHVAFADGAGDALGGVGGQLAGAAGDGPLQVAAAAVQCGLEAEVLARPVVERAAADAGGGRRVGGRLAGQ